MLYKIGITEAGDAGIDLSWAEKLSNVDAAVLITKSISQSFIDSAFKHMEKLIIHATITGYGHTILEPNVPTLVDESTMVTKIVESGFPIKRIVIRVDPIIPTDKGIKTAWSKKDAEINTMGYQRKGCMCYAGKTELLSHKTKCSNGCLYCYWKDITD